MLNRDQEFQILLQKKKDLEKKVNVSSHKVYEIAQAHEHLCSEQESLEKKFNQKFKLAIVQHKRKRSLSFLYNKKENPQPLQNKQQYIQDLKHHLNILINDINILGNQQKELDSHLQQDQNQFEHFQLQVKEVGDREELLVQQQKEQIQILQNQYQNHPIHQYQEKNQIYIQNVEPLNFYQRKQRGKSVSFANRNSPKLASTKKSILKMRENQPISDNQLNFDQSFLRLSPKQIRILDKTQVIDKHFLKKNFKNFTSYQKNNTSFQTL